MMSSQSGRKGHSVSEEALDQSVRYRVRILGLMFLLVVGAIVSRLVYLQVFVGGQHVLLSEGNHVERETSHAERGNIYDRNGVVLTANHPEMGGRGREYLYKEATAHLLGYVSEVTDEQVGCFDGVCYQGGEWIGKTGVEKVMENTLKGKDGGRIVEVDASGRVVRELGENEPEKGEDVTLSIDAQLQRDMAEVMGEQTGSVVAVDMQGKLLGLYSSPSYDPNLFTIAPKKDVLEQILTDSQKMYLLDRAIGGVYAPGSVFKLVTSYAGLETGEIDPSTEIEDTGEIRINQYRYGNWYFDQYGRKEGFINLPRAIARSNDIYFYKVGERVGVDLLSKWASKFGLGEATGIGLTPESIGLVPTRLWKERTTGEKWFLGNTYHMAIGQGDLQVTPLQVARMTAAAISGRLCEVSVLFDKEVECRDLGLKEEYIQAVREGMKGACSSGGTAFPFFDFIPYVICKTGTAEHSGQVVETDLPHAWVTVGYPGENPKMVLTVMLPEAGEGSEAAAPIAKEILSRWRDQGN